MRHGVWNSQREIEEGGRSGAASSNEFRCMLPFLTALFDHLDLFDQRYVYMSCQGTSSFIIWS